MVMTMHTTPTGATLAWPSVGAAVWWQHRAGRTAAREPSSPVALVGFVVGAMLAVSVAVGAISDDDIAPPGPVLLVGDSLFFQSGDELRSALEDDGWEVHTVAHPGAGIKGGGYTDNFEWSSTLREVVNQVRPEVAIVELGTNGCGDGCSSVPDAIDGVLDSLVGVDTVLWLTVRVHAPRPGNPRSINDDLRAAAESSPNLELLPFGRWMEQPGLIRPDGVHLTPAGQLVLAAHVRDALRERAGIGDDRS